MRRIVTAQMQAAGGPAAPIDGYFDRIIKYIPTDVVAGWVALDGIARGLNRWFLWALLAAFALLAFLWTRKQTMVPGGSPATKQSLIATASFIVWAFALHSGPFGSLTYRSEYGSIALIVYTLSIGLMVP